MSTFTEVVYISQFDIQLNGCIGVRKTTDVLKDGVVISSTYWRTVLVPNDPTASTVLDEAVLRRHRHIRLESTIAPAV
jgi:hypothetical protein